MIPATQYVMINGELCKAWSDGKTFEPVGRTVREPDYMTGPQVIRQTLYIKVIRDE